MRLHDVVIHEADAARIDGVLRRFLADSSSAAALLIDRSGQPLAETGTARTLDVGSIYLCLLQLWQRLRVWLPGGMEPLLHPEAPPPALLI